jgi:penicillin-binding protein 1C
LRRAAAAAAGAALLGAVALGIGVTAALPDAPDFAAMRARLPSSEAVLLDRHGAVLHERRVDARARRLAWTPLAEIAPAVREDVVASEDRRFSTHGGVDWLALGGALRDAALGRQRRGASTITMQLAARLDPALRSAPTLRGAAAKWRQMRAARALERRLTKDEILEAYLNLVSFRGELEGVAAASRGLFGRAPGALGATESAILAALLPAPNAPAPAVAARACGIAARLGSETTCAAVRERTAAALAGVLPIGAGASGAPHLAARLLPSAGATRERVRTTIDAALQARVTDVLRRHVGEIRDRNARDAAALVADNATGEILAWVGGIGRAASAPHVDAVRAPRQAGSSQKPFLYAAALDRRLVTAATRLDDSPLDVVTALGSYRPENYDKSFRGLVPVREALASSLNVPAVRLLQLAGVGTLGFAGLRDADHYGQSLALGSPDVSLFELVGGYRAIAIGGAFAPLRVTRDEAATAPVRVFSPEAAWLVSDILADRASRAPTFGLENPLATRVWSAAKTGTSKDMRDNWCLGFTRRYTIGVWVGNLSGASMWDVSGVEGAAPAWLAIVNALHEGVPSDPPAPPAGVVRAGREWFLAGTEPAALAAAATASRARDARIVAPEDGLILALDPDIPDARERLRLEAGPAADGLVLRLDGRDLGPAGSPVLWQPERGQHRLALVGAEGAVLHTVSFEVR